MFDYTQIQFWTFTLGGLGLFLFGIVSLSKTLKRITGNKLKKFLSKCSDNPIKGLLTGAGFTSIIQSSSATTALTVGLVRAGILTFVQAAGIIIGANIGTTITAFIISIPILEYMPIVLFIGSIILLLTTRQKLTNVGDICFALGSIFFGLWLIDINLESLSSYPWFKDTFIALNNSPWLGLLIGALSSAIFQSSSAVIGVLQGIYAISDFSGITFFGIAPIVLGANIGTTIDVILASIGGNKDAKRVALFHVLFNVIGSLIFMGLIYACQDFLKSSSSWPIDPKLQIALFHLIFNSITAFIVIPILKPIDKLFHFIIKGEDVKRHEIKIKELDTKAMKEFPSAGIQLAKEEVDIMFSYVIEMFENINKYLQSQNQNDAIYVHELEISIDKIDRLLNEYLLLADKGELSENDLKLFTCVLKGCKDIERLGDYGENLINFFESAYERKNKFHSSLFEDINLLNKQCLDILKMTQQTYINQDKELSLSIISLRREYILQTDALLEKYYQTFSNQSDKKISYLNLVYADIISDYQRVFSHCSNIAKLFNNDKTYI